MSEAFFKAFAVVLPFSREHSRKAAELFRTCEGNLKLTTEDGIALCIGGRAVEICLQDILFADPVVVHALTVAAGRGLRGVIGRRPRELLIVYGHHGNRGQLPDRVAPAGRVHIKIIQRGVVVPITEDRAAENLRDSVNNRVIAGPEKGLCYGSEIRSVRDNGLSGLPGHLLNKRIDNGGYLRNIESIHALSPSFYKVLIRSFTVCGGCCGCCCVFTFRD